MENPFHVAKTLKKKLKRNERHVLKDTLNNVCKELNETFVSAYGVSFDESFQEHNKLENRQSRESKRELKKKHYKEVVGKINTHNEATMVDRLYGAGISEAKWDRERKKKYFENVPEAENRSAAEKMKVKSGIKKTKDHVGSFSAYQIDPALLDIAASWTETDEVKWKRIGDEYIRGEDGKIPFNSGQIAKHYLIDKEKYEAFQYTYKGKGEEQLSDRVRRKKKRLMSDISFPSDPPTKKVKEALEELVASGKIDIGENIVQREYKRTVLDKSTNQLVEKICFVFGRKHSLRKIRIKLFKKCKKFMRLNDDSFFENISREELIKRLRSLNEFNDSDDFNDMKEKLKKFERTRCLQVWHDGSSLQNHGHVLFCVNVVYDPAVFYTSAEYSALVNKKINVQREVEAPELYIIARCGSNDEQLAYIKTRVEDLLELKNGLRLGEIDVRYEGIVLQDQMRFFHGDGPAAAFEAGNQKGGHYFCPNCDIHICLTDDIACCYQQKIKSLAEKQSFILGGTFGKSNSLSSSLQKKAMPFEKLTVPELKVELNSRNVDIKHLKDTLKDLGPTLKKVLRGAKRLPILLLDNPLCDLNYLGLANYEITLVECMHDVANHIDNLFLELPNHLKKEDKTKMSELLAILNKEKEQKRCCDKRKILLQVTKSLEFKIDGNVHRLLRTLCEIQRILYLSDDFRTPKEILRLHNTCFEHFVLLKKIIGIGELSSKMTRDKLFGKYKHNLLDHAPLQYRLVSGESINCEDEERFFKTIRSITHGTTNNQPGQLIGNLIVRLEVESSCKDKYQYYSNDSTVNEIHDLGVTLYAQERNSIFTYDFIQENNADWQSHLERISDFLIFENKWWKKTEFGIEFFDFLNEPENRDLHPKLHHFRSSNIKTISCELEEQWNFIVKNQICIPIHQILEGNEDEIVRYTSTSFLTDKIFSNTPSFQKRSANIVDTNGEDVDEEFPDFQYFDADPILTPNLEETSEIACLEGSHQDNFETTIDTSLETSVETVDTTLEEGNRFMSDCASEHMQGKLTSTLISGIDELQVVSSSSSVTTTLNYESEPNSSANTMRSSAYVTQEATAISLVLGDTPELKKYDRTKSFCKQNKTTDNFIYNMLMDLQVVLQTKVSGKVYALSQELEGWERSFLAHNKLCSPSPSDYESNTYIADVCKKIGIGKQLLRKWDIPLGR